MKSVKLFSEFVGDGHPCYIIAEIGNSFKNFQQAKRLIDSAKKIGVNAVKFQTWDAETVTTKKNFFDMEATGHVSQYEFHKKIQISEELQKKIMKYAKERKIVMFSAPSHIKDLELMEKINVPIYKIGSDLACHIPLLKKVAKFDKPIILSTGMCTIDEVQNSVSAIYNEGNEKLILLHCVANYPAQISESNLEVINTMKKEFGIPVGFSDHTKGILIPTSAAVMGANVIEKHMKHPVNPSFPDNSHSLIPSEFLELIKSIRLIESAKGSGKKIPTKSEQKNLKNNRVSIVTLERILKGTKISRHMIDIKRPGSGIQPIYWNEVIKKIAKKDIDNEIPLQWNMLE
jgi:sialic acid synthase SpsE